MSNTLNKAKMRVSFHKELSLLDKLARLYAHDYAGFRKDAAIILADDYKPLHDVYKRVKTIKKHLISNGAESDKVEQFIKEYKTLCILTTQKEVAE